MLKCNVIKSLYRFQLFSPDGEAWAEAIPAESEAAARLYLYGQARLCAATVGPCLGAVNPKDITPPKEEPQL